MVSRTVTEEVLAMALCGGGSLGRDNVDQLPWFPDHRRKCRGDGGVGVEQNGDQGSSGDGVDVEALLSGSPIGAWQSRSETMIFGSSSECHGGGGVEGSWRRVPRWWFARGATDLRQGWGATGVE
jgi:hypothetical protein